MQGNKHNKTLVLSPPNSKPKPEKKYTPKSKWLKNKCVNQTSPKETSKLIIKKTLTKFFPIIPDGIDKIIQNVHTYRLEPFRMHVQNFRSNAPMEVLFLKITCHKFV